MTCQHGVFNCFFLALGIVGGVIGAKLKIPAGALVVLALDSQAQPMLVVCFHFVRVVFVLLTAPFVFKWLSG